MRIKFLPVRLFLFPSLSLTFYEIICEHHDLDPEIYGAMDCDCVDRLNSFKDV